MHSQYSPEEIRKLFEQHLEREVNRIQSRHLLYAPMVYLLGLKAKRARPVLAMLTFQAITGKEPVPALDLALALELFHNFTLMHDDIMDNAPMRRGMKTVHEKWDTNTAILAGDALFSLAGHYLTVSFPHHAASLSSEFSRISLGVCEGQLEDMELAKKEIVTQQEYIEMIRKKTAMLIGGAMRLGAIAAGSDATTRDELSWLGEACGLSFQLMDDYLDAYGNEESFGKQTGGDILENKNTWLLIRAKEKAQGASAAELKRLLKEETDPAKKIAGVLELYKALGIADETKEKIKAFDSQMESIQNKLIHLPGYGPLRAFLDQLTARKW